MVQTPELFLFEETPMSTTTPMSAERRQQIETYQAKLYRSTYAIRKELQAGLSRAVEASGAASVSDLLAMLARDPEGTGAALKPIFAELITSRSEKPSMRAALQQIKESDLTPEEILAALESARAAKEAGSGHQE